MKTALTWLLFALLFLLRPIQAQQPWQPFAINKYPRQQSQDMQQPWLLYQIPVKASLKNHWLKVSIQAESASHYTNIWMWLENNAQHNLFRWIFPQCHSTNDKYICSNTLWISSGDYLKIRLNWPYQSQPPSNIRAEIAKPQPISPSREANYQAYFQNIKNHYYRSKEVNWEQAYSAGFSALSSPADTDPVPHSISQLMAHLPDTSHMQILAKHPISDASNNQQPQYPECHQLNDTTHRLDIPGTQQGPGVEWTPATEQTFIAQAHACFTQHPSAHWIINLTENRGGNANLLFAALAPVLGNGVQLYYRNNQQQDSPLSIEAKRITINGQTQISWESTPVYVTGQREFAINKNCASSCEAVALAAKAAALLVGEKTAGLTTANEVIPLSDDWQLQLTCGWILDKQKNYWASITPDTELDAQELANYLKHGHKGASHNLKPLAH